MWRALITAGHFRSVTSLSSCASGERRRKCFNGSGPPNQTLLLWQLFNYLQMNGSRGDIITGGAFCCGSVFLPFWFSLTQRHFSKMASSQNGLKVSSAVMRNLMTNFRGIFVSCNGQNLATYAETVSPCAFSL